jgi:hypothetical protein
MKPSSSLPPSVGGFGGGAGTHCSSAWILSLALARPTRQLLRQRGASNALDLAGLRRDDHAGQRRHYRACALYLLYELEEEGVRVRH